MFVIRFNLFNRFNSFHSVEARLDSKLMSDEIFGPVLPIIKVKDVNAAIDIIKTMEKPLALYIFSKNQTTIDQ